MKDFIKGLKEHCIYEGNEHHKDILNLIAEIEQLEAIVEKARAVVKKWNAPPDDGFYLFSLIRELQRALAAYDKATKEAK